MASMARSENAFSRVKGKSSIGKSLSSLLKEPFENVSQAEQKLADHMEEIAEKENGVFDEDDLTISFGTTEEMVIVYGSLDTEDNPVYQAMYRSSKPTLFNVGNPRSSISEAITSLEIIRTPSPVKTLKRK